MIEYIRNSITLDKKRLKYYRSVAATNPDKQLRCKSRKGRGTTEYYARDTKTGEERYLGLKDYKTIVALQRKRVAEIMVRNLKNNIDCKQRLCDEIKTDNIETIISDMPKGYQLTEKVKAKHRQMMAAKGDRSGKVHQSENPTKREEINICTSFNLYVRTKGEAAIAEILHSLGITFYYEKGIRLDVIRRDEVGVPFWTERVRYPDFTIPIGDGKSVFWEHKGMLSDRGYVENDIQRDIDYNMNNIYQSHNLIVTAEGQNNAMDLEGIMRIINGWLMPLLNM